MLTEWRTCWKQYNPLKLCFAGGGGGEGGLNEPMDSKI